jgi:hypothetical protein
MIVLRGANHDEKQSGATSEIAPGAIATSAETKKKLDALETTMAISSMPSSEIKKLILAAKSHGYHMDALKAAYSASLAAEAAQ